MKFPDDEVKKAKQEAASQAKGMLLNVVRLCFQCYLTDNEGNVIAALNSLVSDPIYDSSKILDMFNAKLIKFIQNKQKTASLQH